jgi:hypothetical protein
MASRAQALAKERQGVCGGREKGIGMCKRKEKRDDGEITVR